MSRLYLLFAVRCFVVSEEKMMLINLSILVK